MKIPEFKGRLLFDRLKKAREPEKLETKKYIGNAPMGKVLPYIEEGKNIEIKDINTRFDVVGNFFFDKLDFELSHIAGTPEFDRLREKLKIQFNPLAKERALRDLQDYLKTNPCSDEQAPILAIIKELPLGFGFLSVAKDSQLDDRDIVALKKEGRKLNINIDQLPFDKEHRWNLPINHEIAMHFAIGSLYPAGSLESYREGGPRDNRPNKESLDIPWLIRIFKAAQKRYEKAWEKNDSNNLRLMKKKIVHLEWRADNHLFETEEEQNQFGKMKDWEGLLSSVAQDAGGGVSWPFFLKKLWEEEDLLQNQFKKVDYQNPLDNISNFVDDPRFEEALYKIGEILAPVTAWSEKRSELPKKEEYIAIAHKALEEYSKIYTNAPRPHAENLKEVYMDGARQIQWEEILKFKGLLKTEIDKPKLFERAQEFTEGFYRDFLLSEAWKKEPQKDRKTAERYLELMQKETPDGAKLNRAPDLMNRYVQGHYQEGTWQDPDLFFNLSPEIDRNKPSVYESDFKNDESLRNSLHFEFRDAANYRQLIVAGRDADNEGYQMGIHYIDNDILKIEHNKRKQALQEKWQEEKTIPGRYLYVFSDAASRKPGQEAVTDKSYAMRLITEFANNDLDHIKEKLDKGEDIKSDVGKNYEWINKHLKEPCLLRDFYLDNVLNLRLWEYLKNSRLRKQLATENIKLSTIDVDLEKHLKDKDDGVLQDAYFTKYTLFRVDGLAAKINLFSLEEKIELAGILKEFSQKMSPMVAESYERIILELEAEKLKADYKEIYDDAMPRDHAANDEEARRASDKAFSYALDRILKTFSMASYNRDELLERFALDFATTPEQIKIIEEATYSYLARKPHIEEEKKEKVPFAPVEAVKNYLAIFKDRPSRAKIMGWIFGGELPDDRFLEGKSFNINADEEREVFWLMSNAERKAVLYNALMGDQGLFEVPANWDNFVFDPERLDKKIFAGLEGKNFDDVQIEQNYFINFLKSFYENNFAPVLKEEEEGKESMEPALRTIFFEIFKNYSTPRRVELFLAITERMRDLRLNNKKLTAGQAIRLFLEQVGVVGIKAGQVISEQKGMVSDEVKRELSSLRDKASPFSKFGVFTYLKTAGLLGEAGEETKAPFQISEVGECLGSASIKQAHLAWTKERKAVVVKVPRPTIDKNYAEDVKVLEIVMGKLREQGVKVPEFLLKEIVDACTSEFDFSQEGVAQRDVDKNLYNRKASIALESDTPAGRIPKESIRLDAPDLELLVRKGESRVKNLQLMIDEYIGGFNLLELQDYQRLNSKADLTPEEQAQKNNLEQKINKIYGMYAALAREDLATISIESMRAQIALDLIEQIISDGVFHADLHSGNAIVDVKPKAKRLALIDFGSVGRSVEVTPEKVIDHRESFKEFLGNLMFLKMNMGDSRQLGKIVDQYVKLEGYDADRWSEQIAKLNQDNATLGEFFKELLSDILTKKAEINRQFKFLLKALAAAGGHFDALSDYLKTAISESIDKGVKQRKPIGEILLGYPGFHKLKPLVEGNKQLKTMLGL
jgi:predicted unusual protein kinase regulating ubiquinone biosynthesis (AarF/ABC1/UbiB family)